MTDEEALDLVSGLAVDLLRELTPLAGDADAVREVMTRWLSTLGGRTLGLVCAKAVHLTFTECLTPTPIEDVPAGRLAFTAHERTPAA